ncbi:hypothetical protein ACWCYY_35420 [Kitasatospora sp. NPDC001664]
MCSDHTFEEDLTHAMARAGEAFHTDAFRLEAAGLARGRRLWRRRQVGRAVGAATALALVSGGAYLFAQPGVPAGAPIGPALGPNPSATAPSGAATPSGGAGPTGRGRTSGPVPVATERVLAALKSALPPGAFSEVHGVEEQDVPRDGAWMQTRFDDGAGLGQISVSVTRFARQVQVAEGTYGCRPKSVEPAAVCRIETLPDGSVLRIHQGLEYPDGREDTKFWSALLAGKDGRVVEIDEWNAPESKGAPVSRPTPPLSVAQLTAALQSRAWDPVVADLPTAGERRSAASASPGQAVLPSAWAAAVAGSLMPPGLIGVPAGHGADGRARLTVKGGENSGLLDVLVEDHRADLPGYGDRYRAAEVRDGHRVLVSSGSGSAPRWRVDVLRPDGRRVLLEAYAGSGPELHEGQALLDAEQLITIAVAPGWATG